MSSTVTQIGLIPTTPASPNLQRNRAGLRHGLVNGGHGAGQRGTRPGNAVGTEQTTLNNQNSAFTTIQGDLTTLQTDIQTLQNSGLYTSRTAQSSDSSATATAGSGTNIGTYSFNISQLATATIIKGASGINSVLSPDGNLTT